MSIACTSTFHIRLNSSVSGLNKGQKRTLLGVPICELRAVYVNFSRLPIASRIAQTELIFHCSMRFTSRYSP